LIIQELEDQEDLVADNNEVGRNN
jgi:hypothetical protein